MGLVLSKIGDKELAGSFHTLGPQASALTSYSEPVFSKLQGPSCSVGPQACESKCYSVLNSVGSSRNCGRRNLTVGLPTLRIRGEIPRIAHMVPFESPAGYGLPPPPPSPSWIAPVVREHSFAGRAPGCYTCLGKY